MANYALYFAADNYDCAAYGAGTFNAEQICSTTGTSDASGGGTLANTGAPIFFSVISVAIIVVAVVIFAKTLRRKKAAPKA